MGEAADMGNGVPDDSVSPTQARGDDRGASRRFLPAVVLTLVVVLAIVIVAVLLNRHANGEILKLHQREQRLVAFHQARHIAQEITLRVAALQGLGEQMQQTDLAPGGVEALLTAFLERHQSSFAAVGYMDQRGALTLHVNARGSRPPADLAFTPHVKRALATQGIVVSGATLSPDGETGIALHVPVTEGGQFRGNAVATIRSETVGTWLARNDDDQHGFSILVDASSLIVHHPDARFVNESIFASPAPAIDGMPLAENLLRDGKVGVASGRAFRGQAHVVGMAAVTVHGARFLVIKCAPYAAIAAPVLRFSRYTSVLTGLTFLVTALGFLYAFYIFRVDTTAWMRQSSALRQDIRKHEASEAEYETLIAQLERNNAELERFAYTVSHDLKSPLITIRGFLGMLERDIADGDEERIKSDISRIANATENMQRLLDELLELSRVGRLENPPEDFDLGEVTREVLELLAGRMQDRNVEINVSPALPVIHGDRPRFREVMQNLIENALKFMGDQPEPRIDVAVRQDDDATVVTVKDNGIGLDMAYADRIFLLFEQLDPSIEGTGMGLAMVKRILEHAGSRIWVESEGPGRGATFCFIVPPGKQEDEVVDERIDKPGKKG